MKIQYEKGNEMKRHHSTTATDDAHCSWYPCRPQNRSAAAHTPRDLPRLQTSALYIRAASLPQNINTIAQITVTIENDK